MKSYPSIPYATPEDFGFECTAFYKYDGSNLRFEYSKKRGWWKFGTRNRLFDKTDPDFGSAIDLFLNNHAEGVEKVLKDNKEYKNSDAVIVFAEFFGAKSFSGQHVADDPKELVIFDINIHKKGLVSPRDFVNNFGHLKIAETVYRGPLTQDFLDAIWRGEYPVVEGVIIKWGSGHKLSMRKMKTEAYKKRLIEFFGMEWERYW